MPNPRKWLPPEERTPPSPPPTPPKIKDQWVPKRGLPLRERWLPPIDEDRTTGAPSLDSLVQPPSRKALAAPAPAPPPPPVRGPGELAGWQQLEALRPKPSPPKIYDVAGGRFGPDERAKIAEQALVESVDETLVAYNLTYQVDPKTNQLVRTPGQAVVNDSQFIDIRPAIKTLWNATAGWVLGRLLQEVSKIPERLAWLNLEGGFTVHMAGSAWGGPSAYEMAVQGLLPEDTTQEVLEAHEKSRDLTPDQLWTLWQEGTIGYTLMLHPEPVMGAQGGVRVPGMENYTRLDQMRYEISQGMTYQEAETTYGDFWTQMIGETLLDPSNMLGPTATKILFPGLAVLQPALGFLGKAVVKDLSNFGEVLSKKPLLEWLTTTSQRSLVRRSIMEASDSWSELATHAASGEELQQLVTNIFRGSQDSLDEVSEMSARLIRNTAGQFASDGVRDFDGLIARYVPNIAELLDQPATKAALSEDPELVVYLLQRASEMRTIREIEKQAGYGLLDNLVEGKGGLAGFYDFAGGVWKENLLGVNPAYVTANLTDNTVKAWLWGHYINPLNFSAPTQITGYMKDYGGYLPGMVKAGFISDMLSGMGQPKMAQIPIPGIGKPSEIVDFWGKLLGTDFRERIPLLKVLAPVRTDPLVDLIMNSPAPSRLASLLDNLNYSRLVQGGASISNAVESTARTQIFYDTFRKYVEDIARPTLVERAYQANLPQEIISAIRNPAFVKSADDIVDLLSKFGDAGQDVFMTKVSSLIPESATDDLYKVVAEELDGWQDMFTGSGNPAERVEEFMTAVDGLFDALLAQADEFANAAVVEDLVADWRTTKMRDVVGKLVGQSQDIRDSLRNTAWALYNKDPKMGGAIWPRYFDEAGEIAQTTMDEIVRLVQSKVPAISDDMTKVAAKYRTALEHIEIPGLSASEWDEFGARLFDMRMVIDDASDVLWDSFLKDPTLDRLNAVGNAYDDLSKLAQKTADEASVWRDGFLHQKGRARITEEVYQARMHEIWTTEYFSPAQDALLAAAAKIDPDLVEGPTRIVTIAPLARKIIKKESLAWNIMLVGGSDKAELMYGAAEGGHWQSAATALGISPEDYMTRISSSDNPLAPVVIARFDPTTKIATLQLYGGREGADVVVQSLIASLDSAGLPAGSLVYVPGLIDEPLEPLAALATLRAVLAEDIVPPEPINVQGMVDDLLEQVKSGRLSWQEYQTQLHDLLVNVQHGTGGFNDEHARGIAQEFSNRADSMRQVVADWREAIVQNVDDFAARVTRTGSEVAELKATLQGLAKEWAQSVSTGIVKGSLETDKILFNYTMKQNWEELLRYYAPFTTWQIRNPIMWLQLANQRPGVAAFLQRYYKLTEDERKRRGLTTRFEGTVPLPGQEWLQGQGVLPEGYYGMDPSALFSIMSQGQEPFVSPGEEQLTGPSKWINRALRMPEWAGITPYPWIQWPAEKLGLYGDRPGWGVTGPVGRAIPGVRRWEQEQGWERVPGSRWLHDFSVHRQLSIMVEEGRADSVEASQALGDPDHPLWKRAEEEVLKQQDVLSTYRALIPASVKYAPPGEMELREGRKELRGMPESRAAYTRGQDPAQGLYSRAIGYVDSPDWATWAARRDAVYQRYNRMIGELPPWHPRVKELKDAMYAEIESLGAAPERMSEFGYQPDQDVTQDDVMFQLEQSRPKYETFVDWQGNVDWEAYNQANQEFMTVVEQVSNAYGRSVSPQEWETFRSRYDSPEDIAWKARQEQMSGGWDRYGVLREQQIPEDFGLAPTQYQGWVPPRGLPEGFEEQTRPSFGGLSPEIQQWALQEWNNRKAAGWTAEQFVAWAQGQGIPYAEVQSILTEEGFGPKPMGEMRGAVERTRPWLRGQGFESPEWGRFGELEGQMMPGMFEQGRTQNELFAQQFLNSYYSYFPNQRRMVDKQLGIPEDADVNEWMEEHQAEYRAMFPYGLADLPPSPAVQERYAVEKAFTDWRLTGKWDTMLDEYYGNPSSGSSQFWDYMSTLVLSDDAYDDPIVGAIMKAGVRNVLDFTDEQYRDALEYIQEHQDSLVNSDAMALRDAHPDWWNVAQEQSPLVRGVASSDGWDEYHALKTPNDQRAWRKANADQWAEMTDRLDNRNVVLAQNPYYTYFFEPDKYKQWFGDTPPDKLDVAVEVESYMQASRDMAKVSETGGSWTKDMERWYGDADSASSQFWSYYFSIRDLLKSEYRDDGVIIAALSSDVRGLIKSEDMIPVFEEARKRLSKYYDTDKASRWQAYPQYRTQAGQEREQLLDIFNYDEMPEDAKAEREWWAQRKQWMMAHPVVTYFYYFESFLKWFVGQSLEDVLSGGVAPSPVDVGVPTPASTPAPPVVGTPAPPPVIPPPPPPPPPPLP